jgi:hypothetical protein
LCPMAYDWNIRLLLFVSVFPLCLIAGNTPIQLHRRISFVVALRGGKEFNMTNPNCTATQTIQKRVGYLAHCLRTNYPNYCTLCHSSAAEFGLLQSTSANAWAQLVCRACMASQTSLHTTNATTSSLLPLHGRCSNCSRWAVFGDHRLSTTALMPFENILLTAAPGQPTPSHPSRTAHHLLSRRPRRP